MAEGEWVSGMEGMDGMVQNALAMRIGVAGHWAENIGSKDGSGEASGTEREKKIGREMDRVRWTSVCVWGKVGWRDGRRTDYVSVARDRRASRLQVDLNVKWKRLDSALMYIRTGMAH